MTLTAPDEPCAHLTWKQRLWLSLIGLLGTSWLWFVLSQHGIGLSPDSVGYLAVAQHLLEGKGFLSYQSTPFIAQPPLYPLTIAALSLCFGFTLTNSALILNLSLFAFVAYLSGRLVFLVTKSFAISLIASVSVIFGVPIIWVSIFAWSEMLFIFFTILSLLNIISFSLNRNTKYLLSCSLFIGCSCLTRYVGIFSFFSLLLSIFLLPSKNLLTKAKMLLLFSLIPLFLLFPWIARNYSLSETFFGTRIPASLRISEVFFLFEDTLLSWFIFTTVFFDNIIMLSVTFISLSFVLFIVLVNQMKNITSLSIVIFIFTYSLLTLISSIFFAHDPVDSRLLSPIFIPIVTIFLNFSYKQIFPYLRRNFSQSIQSRLISSGILIWFIYPVLSTLTLSLEVRQEGKGYQSIHWQTSKTLAYVRRERRWLTQLPIYTNDPEGLYFLADISALHLPFQFRPTWPEPGKAYLVRFKKAYRGECLGIIEQLCQVADIKLVAQFPDGEIYLVAHKGPRVAS
ncbi:MAG: ArnT family glycosyltransferase [Acidobacteriota bacterium]